MDAAVGASPSPVVAGEEARDPRVVRSILRSLGLRECEYDPRVVGRFVELTRRYAGDVLSEAMAYADHAGRASLEADDVRLAIRAKSTFSPGPPRHEVIFDLARSRNTIPLHKATAPPGSIPLPSLEDTMLSANYLVVRPGIPSLDQEIEDCDESFDPNSNTEQEHNGYGRQTEKVKAYIN